MTPAFLPHGTTQSPDVIAYLPVDYTTSQGLAVYNKVKKLATGECALVLGQKNMQHTAGLECFKLYFDFQAKYKNDLRFAYSFGKLGF